MQPLTFTDYDAFAGTIREASMKMQLTAMEESKWMLRYATAGAVRLQHGYEGGGSIAEGTSLNDAWTLYHQWTPFHANGQYCKDGEFFVAPPGTEFCLACQPKHEWITVAIPTNLLFESEVSRSLQARPFTLKPSCSVGRRISSLVVRFLTCVESKPQLLESPAAVDAYQIELLQAIRRLFETSKPVPSRRFVKWYQQAKCTVDIAMHQPDERLTVSELAMQAGIPQRTLRTAYWQCFGISPLEYLRILRLHQARQVLLANCPDSATVTQIAFGLGFWDLGRFAGAYRQLFHELPSETLRKPTPRRMGGSAALTVFQVELHPKVTKCPSQSPPAS